MSSVLRPVGPRPQRVYWLRRLVLLAALVLVAVLVWVAARALGGGGQDGTVAPEADPSTEAPAQDAPAGPVACDASHLGVTLTSDARTYGPDQNPVLSLAVTNTSEQTCTVDVGSGNAVVTVMSGADRIWSSADCATDVPERLLLLDPGAADTSTVAWARERSDAECTAGLPAPRAGTYTAQATLLGIESATAVFDLG